MQFIIDEAFSRLFPKARIGIVLAQGIDNRSGGDSAAAELADAAASAAASLGDADLASHPAVAPWREAYRRFGVKPAKHRSSIENLLRSARAGSARSVNPLVDCYNAVSLRHFLPCGGEDLDAIAGDLRLSSARGGEAFIPLGATEDAPPRAGEVVYADDLGIVCRAWNWREAERTRLTAETTRAILVIEALPPRADDELQAALDALAGLVSTHVGGTCRVALLGGGGPNQLALDA